MALWWIKGVQKATEESIGYLLDAESEEIARQKAASHCVEVRSVEAYQGSTELSAIRAELAQLRHEVGSLRGGLLKKRNRLRDKPVWTIAIGVFFGITAFVVICVTIFVASRFLLPTTFTPYQ
ncbi:MAG: hypothetical protein H6814_09505 [Phycisphaeraceae bacterium]|nr:hypothetical protein [Phycisphaeraceae bacterium]